MHHAMSAQIPLSISRVHMNVPTLHMLPCLPGILVRALLRAAANLLVAIRPQLPSRSNALERINSQSMILLLHQRCHPTIDSQQRLAK